MVALLEMEDAKTVSSPSLIEDRPDDDEELTAEAARIYRSCVGIALYVMPDRPDIQRDVQILTRNLREPKAFDKKRLVRLVRYMKGTKTFGMLMKKPNGVKGKVLLELFSDTDFAGCKETRRAMTCGVTRLDKTITSVFARRQGVQSTSSGEAEFYGATSVVMDGRIVKHFLEWLGYEVLYQLHLDSSAAKAMVQRDGVGKVKHMDVRALWIQAERRDHGLVIRKVPGAQNYADLGTKAHPPGRFLELRDMLNIVDCRKIDAESEIEACSVQATGELAWTVKVGRGAAKLERQLLLALLAANPTVCESFSSEAQTQLNVSHWGWVFAFTFLVIIVTLIMKDLIMIRPKVSTSNVRTQSQVTYKQSLDGLTGRFTPLAERETGAWTN
jgi:hypothetical protein